MHLFSSRQTRYLLKAFLNRDGVGTGSQGCDAVSKGITFLGCAMVIYLLSTVFSVNLGFSVFCFLFSVKSQKTLGDFIHTKKKKNWVLVGLQNCIHTLKNPNRKQKTFLFAHPPGRPFRTGEQGGEDLFIQVFLEHGPADFAPEAAHLPHAHGPED